MSAKLADLLAEADRTRRTAEAAEKKAFKAKNEADELERAEAWKKEKTKRRKEAQFAVDNSTLPKWAIKFIESQAWDMGHAYGQPEVDNYLLSWIDDAEECMRKNS